MGGPWERMIRLVRSVLFVEPSWNTTGRWRLSTLMVEAEAIVNGRPITISNLNAADNPIPLTLNQILYMKLGIILPSPGNFNSTDLYLRKTLASCLTPSNISLASMEKGIWTFTTRALQVDPGTEKPSSRWHSYSNGKQRHEKHVEIRESRRNFSHWRRPWAKSEIMPPYSRSFWKAKWRYIFRKTNSKVNFYFFFPHRGSPDWTP